MLIAAFLISLIPSICIYLFLRNRILDDQIYRSTCGKALIYGFLSVFPVILMSFIFSLLERLLTKDLLGPVAKEFFHAYLVLALSEELGKYFMLQKLLKKVPQPFTPISVITCMTLIGLGFGLFEDIPYALFTSAGQMLVRGVLAMHAGYGYIMGCLTVKHMKRTGKRFSFAALIVPVLLHGTYDCFLSEEVSEVTDLAVFLPVLLAVFGAAVLIHMFVFLRKHRNDPEYTLPAAL